MDSGVRIGVEVPAAADLAAPRVADFGGPGWLWWAALLTAMVLAGLLLRMVVKARLSAEERKARRLARLRDRYGPGPDP
jgi:hypothetical protein